MLFFVLFGWTGLARTVRSQVLQMKNADYVKAAELSGATRRYIMFRHILPGVSHLVVMSTALTCAGIMIAEAGLSFLGLGLPEPAPEWGTLLSSGRNYIRGYGYLTVFPGLMILITVLGFNLAGDGLRDALDPKLKK